MSYQSEQATGRTSYQAGFTTHQAGATTAPEDKPMDQCAAGIATAAAAVDDQAAVLEALADRILGPVPARDEKCQDPAGNTLVRQPVLYRIQSGLHEHERALQRLINVVNRLAAIA